LLPLGPEPSASAIPPHPHASRPIVEVTSIVSIGHFELTGPRRSAKG
jgi:hypothetical protein